MTGDEDDWNMYACIAQLVLKIEAADSGKPHVENETTGDIGAVVLEKILRGSKSFRGQSHRLEEAADSRAYTIVIVNDEDSTSTLRCHSMSLFSNRQRERESGALGRVVRGPQSSAVR